MEQPDFSQFVVPEFAPPESLQWYGPPTIWDVETPEFTEPTLEALVTSVSCGPPCGCDPPPCDPSGAEVGTLVSLQIVADVDDGSWQGDTAAALNTTDTFFGWDYVEV